MPGLARWTLSLALFAITFGIALNQHWTTLDLVWSLWISSLTLGYGFILASAAGMLCSSPPVEAAGIRPPEAAQGPVVGWVRDLLPNAGEGLVRAIVLLPVVTFVVGFFTFHFGMFHFVHSLFLNALFPLLKDGDFKSSSIGISDFFLIAWTALARYWPFVLAGGLSRIPDYLTAFHEHSQRTMVRPYVNVVKMHLMIFVFGFLGSSGRMGWGVYILLAVFFFPLEDILKDLFKKRPAAPSA